MLFYSPEFPRILSYLIKFFQILLNFLGFYQIFSNPLGLFSCFFRFFRISIPPTSLVLSNVFSDSLVFFWVLEDPQEYFRFYGFFRILSIISNFIRIFSDFFVLPLILSEFSYVISNLLGFLLYSLGLLRILPDPSDSFGFY